MFIKILPSLMEHMITLFDIKIDTKLKVDVGGAMRMMKMKNRFAIEEIVDKAIFYIRAESPNNTGVFRLSVKRLDERGGDSDDGSTERFIRVGPSMYYNKYVLNTTRPSAGRYVPQIDVRIRSGQHPGTRANKVLDRAKNRLRPAISAILNKHYSNFELGRFVR